MEDGVNWRVDVQADHSVRETGRLPSPLPEVSGEVSVEMDSADSASASAQLRLVKLY